MIIGYPPGYTRVLGVSQGYQGLPVRDEEVQSVDGSRYPQMKTLWHPTAEDLRVLLAGGAIELVVLGSANPPVRVDVVGPETFAPIPERAEPPETGLKMAETAEKD